MSSSLLICTSASSCLQLPQHSSPKLALNGWCCGHSDGVVSSEDFALAQAFDINKDGVLDDDERHELRKEMVASLVAKYRRLPHSESEESEQLIRKFTKDIDQTVQVRRSLLTTTCDTDAAGIADRS